MVVKKDMQSVNATEKKEVKKQPLKEVTKKLSYDELLKRVEQLENLQSKRPKDIKEVINFFENKKKKIAKLETFEFHLKSLKTSKKETEESLKSENFEGDKFLLSFKTNENYSPKTLFNISNSEIVIDFCDFLINKINLKIEQLKMEIQKDF